MLLQGIVDGSASKPALVQDTNYMVENPYHIAPYLRAFGAYLGFKKGSHIAKLLSERGDQLTLSSMWTKNH